MNKEVSNAAALEINPSGPVELPYTPDELGELAVEQMHIALKVLAERGEGASAMLFANTDVSSAASAVLANTFLLRIAAAYERVAVSADRCDRRESSLEVLRRRQLEVSCELGELQLGVAKGLLVGMQAKVDAAESLSRWMDLYDPDRFNAAEVMTRLELFRADVRAADKPETGA